MDWRDHIRRFSSDASFGSPASDEAIALSESALGVRLPESLRELLSQSDGVLDRYGASFIWTVEDIARTNGEFRSRQDFRTLYMPFDHLLFFGDAGTGDQFAFSILNGEIPRPDVFAWNHENDSRTWAAPTLEVFVEWWFGGKLSV